MMIAMPSHFPPSREMMDLAFKLTYEKRSVNEWTGPECRTLLEFLSKHINWITVDASDAASSGHQEEQK